MANGISAWTVDGWLDATFCGGSFGIPQIYIGVHSGDPGSGGTSNEIAIDRQPATFSRTADGYVVTAASLQYIITGIADTTVTHISCHDALDDGNWVANMVANQPVPVVEGDVLIGSDGVSFQITDWVA